MTIDVRATVQALTAGTTAAQKQIKFATRVALTRTAQKAIPAQQKEMRDVFQDPTPFTLSALYVQPATSTRLQATVMLKDGSTKATPASKFLAAQIKGGERKQKRFERALVAKGIMPAGFRSVPGAAAPVDAYGNISRGEIVRILAYFQAFPEAGYKANMSDKARSRLERGGRNAQGFTYIVARPGDRLPLGIYKRVRFAGGTALKPVLIFVRSTNYQPIYDFRYVVEMTAAAEFPGEFARAFEEAKRTAR